ncbi:MAG TPA: ATP-binding protein [Pyrinomonadaceae bacterium]|nr:ATP-binding protein [Pyrinomonadaceae bacterium]
MGIRPRILLILILLGVSPALSLSLFNYLTGARVVETELRDVAQRDAHAVASDVEKRLREREDASATLSRSTALRSLVQGQGEQQSSTGLPSDLQAEVRAFLLSSPKYTVAVACLNKSGQPLFRAELSKGADNASVRFQTQDFLPDSVKADERVWTVADSTPLRSTLKRESYGASLSYTIPVFLDQESASAPRGALIVEINLDALLNDAAAVVDSQSNSDSLRRFVIILDHDGNVLFHTNSALRYQVAVTALPSSFETIAGAMKLGETGWQFYDATDGSKWLAAYQPIAPLELSVAVANNYSYAVRSLRFVGWLGAGVTALLGLLMVALVWLILRRTEQSIERITEGAAAIAKGRLDERIEVKSSDETRLLADAFNAMTERLREQIAREAETRQFASFMRLSAMLTHDLKNSILSLSLLVNNMEQQFDRAEFRADAMKSLTEATDKLRALVAKLSEPVRSLSGEFKRPRPVDLIPIIRDVLARTIDPAQSEHDVEIDLPISLVGVADDERIERVFENLVLNAIEAMGTKRGRLTIKAGPAEDGFVFFSVSDTGPGMTEEFQRTKLFRPFSTTKSQGVGLGLYTSRELIRALGGRIDVLSKQGSGTTFTIVLPSGQINEERRMKSNRA